MASRGFLAGNLMRARAISAKIICRVVDSRLTLDAAMAEYLPALKRRDDRGFVKELCFGTLRWFDQLEFILARYLSKPLKPRDGDIRILILVGLYQLHHLDTPAHAAISETVNATVELDKAWAKPLVNAVLRRSQREFHRVEAELDQSAGARYSHPHWLIDRIKQDWPNLWEAILPANNQRPPQHLRVNVSQTSREDYLEDLDRSGIKAEKTALTPCAIHVLDPVDVNELPGFTDGYVSVQDAGAQLAAILLDPGPGDRVLDTCAAPGGKTAHICEIQPSIAEITAIDIDEKRIGRLHDTLTRLKLDATVIKADATRTNSWWDGRLFDRILLDAPCSATGVIRRHPDIKRLKNPEQLAALQNTQSELLASIWPLLKQGGKLVYSTCSLLHDENDRIIETFLDKHPSENPETIQAEGGIATVYGRQLLPCLDATDGFYYAVLTRTS